MTTISPEESHLVRLLPADGVTLFGLHISAQRGSEDPNGRVFPVTVGESPCYIWLPESVWQTWCEATMGTPDPDAIDAVLLSGIAEWGMSPLIACSGAQMQGLKGGPLPCSILPDAIAPVFHWQIELHHFRAFLVGWPAAFFLSLAGKIIPRVRPARLLPPLSLACYAGWCQVSMNELRMLRTGVGLGLCAFGDPRGGECVLQLATGRMARVCVEPEGRVKINALVQDVETLLMEHDDERDSPPSPSINIDDLPQTLLVEVGRLELRLGALRTLSEGDVLPAEARFSPEVKLRLNGRVIGLGELVGCGDHFLVRISRWDLNPAETQ